MEGGWSRTQVRLGQSIGSNSKIPLNEISKFLECVVTGYIANHLTMVGSNLDDL